MWQIFGPSLTSGLKSESCEMSSSEISEIYEISENNLVRLENCNYFYVMF